MGIRGALSVILVHQTGSILTADLGNDVGQLGLLQLIAEGGIVNNGGLQGAVGFEALLDDGLHEALGEVGISGRASHVPGA